ncbi:RDD family protein [Cellulomonas sp. URHE0023]|uniref:RDD family protein n=1 Tax=Cellulomonas sp. URHE0023 TaxID=1380354 RepID=UPI0004873735|nr:RDD family protein [Cellulomonas sp. URHE0023]
MTDTATLPTEVAEHVGAPEPAAWSRRVVAALLDGAILSGATWLVLGADGNAPSLTPYALLGQRQPAGQVHDAVWWFANPWLVGLVVGLLLLQGWTGATPGKRVAGVAVLRATDRLPAGFLTSVARWVAHLLDAILLIGYLRPLWHAKRQTFADSIVGTIVVTTREPAPHPWFARFRRAPSALGSTVVSVAALAACVLGVGFSMPLSSWGSSWESAVPCDEDGTVSGTSASGDARRTGGSRSEQRWWVKRTTDEAVDKELRVRWLWQPSGAQPADLRFETEIQRVDGTTIAETQQAVVTGWSDRVSLDDATVPAADLAEAGPAWTAHARLVADGVVVGACTIDSADWAAADRGALDD